MIGIDAKIQNRENSIIPDQDSDDPYRNVKYKDLPLKDKDGREISIGKFVEIKNNDISDGIVIGFDDDDIDVLEIGDGYSINKEDVEVVGELNG